MKAEKISIAMMTTLSGPAYKGPQMPAIIFELLRRDLLGEAYGIWSSEDKVVYGKNPKIQTSRLLKYMFSINKKLGKVLGWNHYIAQEKIFAMGTFFHRFHSSAVLLKPCPSSIAKRFKKRGKIILIEASENHPRYTYNVLENECIQYGIPLVDSAYTDINHIEDFEKSLEFADRILCLSNYSAETYINYGVPREKIVVTGLSVGSTIEFPKLNENKEITFVSVANHSVLKGTHRLIDLWNKYEISNDLLIIGSVEEEIQKLYIDRPMNPHIKLMGFMDRTEIDAVYCSSPCVHVLLSLSESYGRSVYEALCKSVPQIVSKTATCDYVVDGYNGYIAECCDEDKMINLIQRFCNMDQDEYNRFRKNAYDSVSRDAELFEKRYVDALESGIKKERSNKVGLGEEE